MKVRQELYNVSTAETDLLNAEKDSIDKWSKEIEKKKFESDDEKKDGERVHDENSNTVIDLKDPEDSMKDDALNELLRANTNSSISDDNVGKGPLGFLNSLDDSIKISVKEEEQDINDGDNNESDKSLEEDPPVYKFPKF